MQRFNNKTVLVTGAGRGIGAGVALAFAREGANVVVNDLVLSDETQATLDALAGLGAPVLFQQADVSDRAAVEAMVTHAVDRFGRLDVLAACAAMSIREPILEAKWEDMLRTIQVTQFGVVHVSQFAARQMVQQERNGATGGKIVIISSLLAEYPFPSSAAYNMSKAAVSQFMATLAAEMVSHRINVNAIHPGWIDTPGERNFASEEEIQAAAGYLPWGRLGTPDDIANAVLFLASDAADYITGTTLRVDGGYMLGLRLPGRPGK